MKINYKLYEVYKLEQEDFLFEKLFKGLERPAVSVITMGLTWVAGYDQWAWVAGISAAGIYGTAKFYLKPYIKKAWEWIKKKFKK